ncbi:MAG: O-antigen ligase family protein, partial [Candidatus Falkowbacteria bacterium]|nr:O-antigen ligase family protein [Candidatus Falkowbacteria bacterium]
LESLLVLTKINYGTIGNTAYVSGYLIFNIYFAALLFVRAKDKLLRWLWALPVVLMFFAFNRANTSGAIIGLGFSVLIAIFLFGLFSKAKKIRRASLGIFGALLIGVIIFFSQWQQPWFQNNYRLKSLTTSKNTFQTRLVSWEGAIKDFKYHPWLGVGFGNYANIFDRQFNARFYNYSRGETYFDRAHNNIIEIASTTGIIGLLAYLSIFFFAIRELWLALKVNDSHVGWSEKGRKNIELILLFCLLIAYFIQNLAVFDSLVTYSALMITLGLIAFHYSSLKSKEITIEKNSKFSDGKEYGGLAIGLFLMFFAANYGNIIPYNIFSQTIKAYSQFAQGQAWEGFQTYQEAFKNPHPLARDCKATFTRLISGNPQAVASLNDDSKIEELLSYAMKLSQENLDKNPSDSLKNLEFAQLADLVYRFQLQNKDLFKGTNYHEISLAAINRAIVASPARAADYFIKAQILAIAGDYRGSEAVIKEGIKLNDIYPEGYCRLSSLYAFEKKNSEAQKAFDECDKLDGLEFAMVPVFLANAASSSVANGNLQQALKYTQRLATLIPNDYRLLINLAKIYEQNGKYAEAIATVNRVVELEPSLASTSSLYINQLEAEAAAAQQ